MDATAHWLDRKILFPSFLSVHDCHKQMLLGCRGGGAGFMKSKHARECN